MADLSDFLAAFPPGTPPRKPPPQDLQRDEFMRGGGQNARRRENWRGFEVSQRPRRVHPAELAAFEPDPELDEVLVGWTAPMANWIWARVPQRCILCGDEADSLLEHSCIVYQVLAA